jgi:hypothetical protein
MRASDWALLGGALLAAAGATLVSLALGEWRFFLS